MLIASWLFLALSVLADLLSLIAALRTQSSAPRIRRWGLPFALVAMTALATYLTVTLHDLAASRHAACSLLQSWPDVWEVENLPDGENTGILLGGLGFLERHRKDYPETYGAARALLQGPLDQIPPDGASLTKAAAAMIRLIAAVAEDC